jgi:hypothetical protein
MNETTQLESSTMQQAIVETVQILSLAQQEQVLSFAQSLSNTTPLSNIMPMKPSLRKLAMLPVAEQHRILANYVPMMAEDFRNDPELTEFSVLDGEDWVE